MDFSIRWAGMNVCECFFAIIVEYTGYVVGNASEAQPAYEQTLSLISRPSRDRNIGTTQQWGRA